MGSVVGSASRVEGGIAGRGRAPVSWQTAGVARTEEVARHALAAVQGSRRESGHHVSLQAILPGRGQPGLRVA